MDNIFFFKLDEDVEEDEVLEEEEEVEDEEEEEEEEIQCDNCNETIVFAKNGVFILSRTSSANASGVQSLTGAFCCAEGAGSLQIRQLSSSNPYNVEDSSLSKYDELCWCQNCFENNWKIMRDDLWECDDFEQFEDDEGSGASRSR